MKQIKSQKELDAILEKADGAVIELCTKHRNKENQDSIYLSLDDNFDYEVHPVEIIKRKDFKKSPLFKYISDGELFEY